MMRTADSSRLVAALLLAVTAVVPKPAAAQCGTGQVAHTTGAATVSSGGGTEVHRDAPDIAAYPVGGVGDAVDHYVAVWQERPDAQAPSRVVLRLLDACLPTLVAGSLAPKMEIAAAGDPDDPSAPDPHPQRWPRVAVALDVAGEPAVLMVYNRLRVNEGGVDDRGSELWGQVFLPVADCTGRVRCVCGSGTCLAPYSPTSVLQAPFPIGPVAIDDDGDGAWGEGDRPSCTGGCGGLCTDGLPPAIGRDATDPDDGACAYVPVTADFDVVALPAADGAAAGIFRFAVTWSQGPDRQHARWSFFQVFEVDTSAGGSVIKPLLHDATTLEVPAVRLEGPEAVEAAYTREASPVVAAVPGPAGGAVALAWHELRPQAPGTSELRIAIYDAPTEPAVAAPPTVHKGVVELSQSVPDDEATFTCAATGWSPRPALAVAGAYDTTGAMAQVFLAWDANALDCGWSLPDGHDEDVYLFVLGYSQPQGAPAAIDFLGAPFMGHNRMNERDARFHTVDGEALPWGVVLYQGAPVAASSYPDGPGAGVVVGWQHLGLDAAAPDSESVEQVWAQQFRVTPQGVIVGYSGPVPPEAPQNHQRHGRLAPLPPGALPGPGNWQSPFVAIWSRAPTKGDWQAAEIDVSLVCGDNQADCGCVRLRPHPLALRRAASGDLRGRRRLRHRSRVRLPRRPDLRRRWHLLLSVHPVRRDVLWRGPGV